MHSVRVRTLSAFAGNPTATWALTDGDNSVLSVKGRKVLHIDRNDHYGGYVVPPVSRNLRL